MLSMSLYSCFVLEMPTSERQLTLNNFQVEASKLRASYIAMTDLKHCPSHLLSVNGLFLCSLAAQPDVHYTRPSTVLKWYSQNVAARTRCECACVCAGGGGYNNIKDELGY